MQTDPMIKQLSALLSNPNVMVKLDSILIRVESSLTANSERPQAWEPLELDLFGSVLPDSIKSCWVFVLRAGAVFGAERHPNSHQRTFALKGSGTLRAFRGAILVAPSN